MRAFSVITAIACWCAVATIPIAAHADERAVARDHYQRGTRAYDLGFYEEAIHHYMLAYQAKDDPALLYNIAQANRLAGHAQEALRFYRVYLVKLPRAPNRDDVEHKIAELEKIIVKQQRGLPPDQVIKPSDAPPPLPTPATPATPAPSRPPVAAPSSEPTAPPEVKRSSDAPPPPPPVSVVIARPAAERRAARRLQIAGGVTLGLGVALVGVGGAFAGLAAQSADEINRSAIFDPARLDDFRARQSLEGVFLGLGAAAVVSGVVVLAVGSHRSVSPAHRR
jgi:tetratricopeptide (TPR) repeat protein